MLLSGILPAITTPFYADGSLYLKKLEHNVDRYSRTPIAGMVVLGSTGEAIMLSGEEQRSVLKLAAEVSRAEKVLIAGVGCESAIETLKLTEFAAECGYDVGLVRTPHYYRPQMKPANLLAFYRFVADRSPLPVLLYSVPVFTAYDLPTDVVVELAEHPNIIGIKESGGVIEKIAEMSQRTKHIKHSANVTEVFNAVTGRMLKPQAEAAVASGVVPVEALAGGGSASLASTTVATQAPPKFKMRTKEVGFQILAGSAQKLHASLKAGATGAVLAFAACAPTACFEVYTAWKEGDEPLATEKQQRIFDAATQVAGGFGIPGTKYAMDLNGYYGGPARLPFLPLTGEQKQQIEQLMADIRN